MEILLKCSKSNKDFVCFGSDLFGRSGRTVAARSKTHMLATRETDFFAQRVLCYWNKLPADVKCSESVTSFKSRFDSFRLKGYKENSPGNFLMIFMIKYKLT